MADTTDIEQGVADAIKSYEAGEFCITFGPLNCRDLEGADPNMIRAAFAHAVAGMPKWKPNPERLLSLAKSEFPTRFGKAGSLNWQAGILEDLARKDYAETVSRNHLLGNHNTVIPHMINLGVPVRKADAMACK